MAITIDQLQIEIQARSTSAASSIDALSTSLGKLRTAVKGGAGLTTTTKQLQAFSQAVQSMQAPTQKIAALVAALKPLETIGKSNLGSALNQLKKIPDITAGLDDAKLSAFASKIQQVTVAVRPLAAEMEKVSLGFSKLPANIQRAINANARLTASNKKTAFGFNMLAAKITIVYMGLRRVANIIGGWIKESNDYVENLNLFTVAMGSGAEEAQRFAEHVGEALGIDPSEWMRNQGIFNTLLTGFGVVADKSAIMSKNLTQLGYDLGSFFNISFADAMQKLQSGISGELEPLRRLGYDLSQAKLEAIALSLGIDRSVSSMTQAEKAQLRYYAILTQVTTAQGDMARTLEAPANQLRILQAQATQAARALGNIFIPALNAVLPYAIAFLKVIRMVADSLASLFGFKLPEIDYSGVNGLASGAEDAADALGDAAGNAKKLKGLLAGFDELNVITSDSSGGKGAGVGGGSGGDLGINLPEYDFLGGAIDGRIQEAFDSIMDFFDRIKQKIPQESIDRLLGSFENLLTVWNKFKESVAFAKLSEIIEGLIALGADIFISSLANAMDILASALQTIEAVFSGNWGGALEGYIKTLENIERLITEPFEKFGEFLDANWFQAILDKIDLPEWIKNAFGGLGSDAVDAFLENISGGVLGKNGILAWAKKVYETIRNFFSPESEEGGMFDVGKVSAKGMVSGLDEGFTGHKSFLETILNNRFVKVILDLLGINSPSKLFKDEVGKPVMEGLIEGMSGWDADFKSIFKNIVNAGIGIFNKFIDWVNDKLKISWDAVSILGKEIVPAGSFQLFTIPKIPTYSSGGFPAAGQLFMANEGGIAPELVGTMGGRTTVANNDQIVEGIEEAAYRGFMRAMAQSGESGGETTVIMQVGETELGRVAIRGINKVQRQAGVSLVTG